MPDKGKPGSGWFVTGHAAVALAGAVGTLFQPSPSLRSALEAAHLGPAVFMWSIAFMAAGIGAIVGRLRRRYRAECAAVDVTAAVVALWAGMLLTTRATSAIQLALVLAGLAAVLHGWARHRRSKVDGDVSALQQWVDEVRSNHADDAQGDAQ